VVFDLGNVLIPWDRRRLFNKLIDDPAQVEHFCDHVLTMAENARIDAGLPLAELVADLSGRHPDHREVLHAFGSRWDETVGPAIDGSVAILRTLLDAGHRCYALSNWNADTFASIEDRYPFLAWFDGLVISGREGVIKPDPAIFHLLCDRHDVAPADAVFIDDSATNVDAAVALGFDGIVFTDPDQLRVELHLRGLPG
jgi:2-haloacid dehalogenase